MTLILDRYLEESTIGNIKPKYKKSFTKGSIPGTILKQCVDNDLPFLTNAR